jgi:hypothetical protein
MKKAVRRKRLAVRLLQQAVNHFAVAVCKCSYKPGADSRVVTFERYLKRLSKLAEDSSADVTFWSLHQKVHLRLVKQTLELFK